MMHLCRASKQINRFLDVLSRGLILVSRMARARDNKETSYPVFFSLFILTLMIDVHGGI